MLQLAFDFLFRKKVAAPRRMPAAPSPGDNSSFVWRHGITVQMVRSARAKRYLLRLQRDGSARLALPRRGSRAEAMRFLERSEAWLRRRHEQWQAQTMRRQPWQDGSPLLFRGEEVVLKVRPGPRGVCLSFGDQAIASVAEPGDYRPAVQAHLRVLAQRELPPRTRDLARQHDVIVHRVTVRAQTTRWGSCSARGTISLNWRLIQAPPFVLDYLIVHELMHRREMNHSARYWKLVAEAFPRWHEAETWLKTIRLEGLD